jgi:hypothetical protein
MNLNRIWIIDIAYYIYSRIASYTQSSKLMSYLKSKSELNRAAAAQLYKSGQHPSAVHCAYYSCVQLMKHIIIHKFGKSEEDIDRECQLLDVNGKRKYGGTHEYLINVLLSRFISLGKNPTNFNNVVQLKKLRVKSDYWDSFQVDSGTSSASIRLSDLVLKELRTNFGV